MVTRHDVAVLAGTSDSVVSYVLNGGPRPVAEATRARILAAIETLNYRPNALARSLRSSRSMTLGLVLPDNSNPFFAQLARMLEAECFRFGYTLLFGNAMDDDVREEVYVRALIDRQVDGLILIPSHGARTWSDDLSRSGIPCVILDRDVEIPNSSRFLTDNRGGGSAATAHLMEHGHASIGCLAGPSGEEPTMSRVRGWRDALDAASLTAPSGYPAHVPFGRAAAYAAARTLLADQARPSALFVTSDEQAVGVLRAASEIGLRVPEDLAVCSFDGIEEGAFMVPSLTTMEQPLPALARAAVERLVARIGDADERSTVDVLPARLIARRSCGCPEVPAHDASGALGAEAAR